jgi:hypothetical protein
MSMTRPAAIASQLQHSVAKPNVLVVDAVFRTPARASSFSSGCSDNSSRARRSRSAGTRVFAGLYEHRPAAGHIVAANRGHPGGQGCRGQRSGFLIAHARRHRGDSRVLEKDVIAKDPIDAIPVALRLFFGSQWPVEVVREVKARNPCPDANDVTCFPIATITRGI